MAYRSSGASQIIYSRQYRHSGSKALPNGIVATRPSNLEMRPLWYTGINHVCEVCAATHPFIV
jgi:hypothetical protein